MESDSDFPLDEELAEEFLQLASERIHGLVGAANLVDRQFRSYFGVSYRLCSHLWRRPSQPTTPSPIIPTPTIYLPP